LEGKKKKRVRKKVKEREKEKKEPSKTLIHCPVLGFQILIVLSSDPLTITLPSKAKE